MEISKTGKLLHWLRLHSRLEKKYGKLWPTNNTDLKVKSNPLKITFLEDHISTPVECCWTELTIEYVNLYSAQLEKTSSALAAK